MAESIDELLHVLLIDGGRADDPRIDRLDDAELMQRWYRGEVDEAESDAVTTELAASPAARRRLGELYASGVFDPVTVGFVGRAKAGRQRRAYRITVALTSAAAIILAALLLNLSADGVGDTGHNHFPYGAYDFVNLDGSAKFRSVGPTLEPDDDSRAPTGGTGEAPDGDSLRLEYVRRLLQRMSLTDSASGASDARRALDVLDDCREQPQVHVARGIVFYFQGDFDSALASYEAALEDEPENIAALFSVAILHETNGNATGARACWEQLQRSPLPQSVLEDIDRKLAPDR